MGILDYGLGLGLRNWFKVSVKRIRVRLDGVLGNLGSRVSKLGKICGFILKAGI